MRIYHYGNQYIATVKITDSNGKYITGKLLKGNTRLEVITKALQELALYKKEYLTI